MDARSLDKCDSFKPSNHPGQELRAFERWLRRFDNFFEVKSTLPQEASENQIQSAKRRWLLHVADDCLLDAFEGLYEKSEDFKAATFDEIVDKYRQTLKPNQTVTLTRYKFSSLTQGDETFDAFVNRLRSEITYCDFRCEEDRLSILRDQLVKGCSLEPIKNACFRNEWTLEELIKNGRRIEAAESSSAALQKDEPVMKLTTSKPPQSCFRCGSERHPKNASCPHQKSTCQYCGKVGHIEAACFRKKKGIPPIRSNFAPQRPMAATINRQEQQTPTTKETQEPDFLPIASFLKDERLKRVEVLVDGKELTVIPDSGSVANIIQFTELSPEQRKRIVTTNTTLCPYGAPSFRPNGKIKLHLQWGNRKGIGTFYVVNNNSANLLSRETSEGLGIIVVRTSPVFNMNYSSDDFSNKIMKAYPKVFSGIGKLKTKQVKLHRKPNVKPYIAPYRPIPFHLRQQVHEQIDGMLRDNIIEEFDGPVEYISNPVFVPKQEPGEIRVCCDLRVVNSHLEDTKKPIPTVESLKTRFAGKRFFSKIDFNSAFSQIEVEPESRKMLVFRVEDRLLRYKRMPMGILPASGEFMDAVAPEYAGIPQVALIHDDGIVSGQTEEEHDEALRAFLQKTMELGLTLNPKKCIFKKREIPFWGCIIGDYGVRPDPSKIQALEAVRRPQSKEELISFLAMARSNADFIPQIAQKTEHLRALTKKWASFQWTEKHEQEFNDLKTSFRQDVSLSFFNVDLPTFIVVDASPHGLGAILLQGKDVDRSRPVALASRATTDTESRYPQIDLEALAVDFGLRRFRQYIVGGPTVPVYTDHKPLIPIFARTRLGSLRTDRFMLRNQDVRYKVEYKKGIENFADYLSRHPLPIQDNFNCEPGEIEECEKLVYCLTDNPYVAALTKERIKKCTEDSPEMCRLRQIILHGATIPEGDQLQPFAKVLCELSVVEDIVYRGHRIVLPDCLQETAIQLAHQGAHPGMGRMKSRVRSSYWFPRLDPMVEDFVRTCHMCQIFSKQHLRNPITSAPLPEGPWQELSLDLFGPMPKGNHILVARDNYSRFPAAKIVPSTAAQKVIPALDQIYEKHGTPSIHKTDSGPPFNGEPFRTYSRDHGIEHKVTPPLHPQANEAETFMKPLGKAMKIADFQGKPKQVALDRLLEEYRNTPHPSTGFTPDEVMRKGSNDWEMRRALKATDTKAKARNRRRINTKRNTKREELVTGDWVLVRNNRKRKFDPFYELEPYQIRKAGDTLTIKRKSDGRTLTRHRDTVRKFYGRVPSFRTKPSLADDYTIFDRSSALRSPPAPAGEDVPPVDNPKTGLVVFQKGENIDDMPRLEEDEETRASSNEKGEESNTPEPEPTPLIRVRAPEPEPTPSDADDDSGPPELPPRELHTPVPPRPPRGPLEAHQLHDPAVLNEAVTSQTVVVLPKRTGRTRTSTFDTVLRDFGSS